MIYSIMEKYPKYLKNIKRHDSKDMFAKFMVKNYVEMSAKEMFLEVVRNQFILAIAMQSIINDKKEIPQECMVAHGKRKLKPRKVVRVCGRLKRARCATE